jgi:hypothetical protein
MHKLPLALALLGAAVATSVRAGEKGHFQGLAVVMNTQFQMVKAADGHPGQSVMMGEMEGLVFNDLRQPFLDKAHYHVAWKADGQGNGDCFKTFTVSSGDKVFATCAGAAVQGGYEGTVQLVGGTGKFSGIKGKGRYKLVNVTERVMWDVLEWDYEIP